MIRTWDDITEEVEIQWCGEAYNEGYEAYSTQKPYPKNLPFAGIIYFAWLSGWNRAKYDNSSKDKSI